MFLIFGLGNPGKKYENTRHNIGSRMIDELRSSLALPSIRVINELKSLNFKNVILVKPNTFMNESGKAIKLLLRNNNTVVELLQKGENLLIIHDDIDLPLGKIRIVKNRGSAGHKGVESIIKELRTKNFIRFRIGIFPKHGKPKNPERFVLQKFNKEEEKIVKEITKKTVEAIEFFLKEGLEKTMSEYNK